MCRTHLSFPKEAEGKVFFENTKEALRQLAGALTEEGAREGIKVAKISGRGRRIIFGIEGLEDCRKVIFRRAKNRLAFEFMAPNLAEEKSMLVAHLVARELVFAPQPGPQVVIRQDFSSTKAANHKEALSDYLEEFYATFHPECLGLDCAQNEEDAAPFSFDSLNICDICIKNKLVVAETIGTSICRRIELYFLPGAIEFICYGRHVQDGRYQQIVWALAAILAETYLSRFYLMDYDDFYAQSTVPIRVPERPDEICFH